MVWKDQIIIITIIRGKVIKVIYFCGNIEVSTMRILVQSKVLYTVMIMMPTNDAVGMAWITSLNAKINNSTVIAPTIPEIR